MNISGYRHRCANAFAETKRMRTGDERARGWKSTTVRLLALDSQSANGKWNSSSTVYHHSTPAAITATITIATKLTPLPNTDVVFAN